MLVVLYCTEYEEMTKVVQDDPNSHKSDPRDKSLPS